MTLQEEYLSNTGYPFKIVYENECELHIRPEGVLVYGHSGTRPHYIVWYNDFIGEYKGTDYNDFQEWFKTTLLKSRL